MRSWLPLLLLFSLSGCADLLGGGPREPCPCVSILRDAAEVTHFREGPGREPRDMRLQGRLGEVASRCDIDDGRVVARTSIEVLAERGPAASEPAQGLAFFVALIDPSERILAKEIFHTRFEFEADRPRSAVVEHIEQRFTLRAGEHMARYAILVGFQLTREELDRNRRSRER
ncbi:MAG: hypothetical protein J4F33_09825 [Alphaproteobacteria bacterium]|nr:hypothetical protein [Alphaproteobacteria bacterium]